MKNRLVLIVSLILLSACTADNLVDNQIIGDWIWIQSSGGITGKTETPESTQTTKKLSITKKTVKYFVNNTLESEIGYRLDLGESIRGENSKLIIYDSGNKQSYEIIENNLFIYDNCYDCFQHTYLKK